MVLLVICLEFHRFELGSPERFAWSSLDLSSVLLAHLLGVPSILSRGLFREKLLGEPASPGETSACMASTLLAALRPPLLWRQLGRPCRMILFRCAGRRSQASYSLRHIAAQRGSTTACTTAAQHQYRLAGTECRTPVLAIYLIAPASGRWPGRL